MPRNSASLEVQVSVPADNPSRPSPSVYIIPDTPPLQSQFPPPKIRDYVDVDEHPSDHLQLPSLHERTHGLQSSSTSDNGQTNILGALSIGVCRRLISISVFKTYKLTYTRHLSPGSSHCISRLIMHQWYLRRSHCHFRRRSLDKASTRFSCNRTPLVCACHQPRRNDDRRSGACYECRIPRRPRRGDQENRAVCATVACQSSSVRLSSSFC